VHTIVKCLLTDAEVEPLSRNGQSLGRHKEATMILLAYRHRLRASELVDLQWNQMDFDTASVATRRAKNGTQATHPIRGDELRALRRLQWSRSSVIFRVQV
jgi:integrase